MTELNTSAGANRHQGIARSKKLSTRVDLTPMVDLGFLLITFFVFTTTISQPSVMPLVMPDDNKPAPPTRIKKSTALTIVPLENDKVFYYHGDLTTAEKEKLYGVTSFSVSDGIGAVIREKQGMLDKLPNLSRKDLMLIIRPASNARFQNIVDAIDEVLINDLSHYSFVDLTPEEMKFIEKHKIK